MSRDTHLKTNIHFALTVLSSDKGDAVYCVTAKDSVTVMLLPLWQRRKQASLCLSPLAVDGVRDHNIISRQEGTCWWNMRKAEGHCTGVNINTNTASQND